MAEARLCPECAGELPGDAPENLCPKCLFQQGLSDSDVDDAAGHPSPGTQAYQGRFTPPNPADLAVHFPQLEILELLGQGGMGAVYKARQRKLDRLVAVKIMPPGAGADPAFAQRFGREARALARLSHPNIVAVHDYGEAGGLYYFIMEYVDGLNLRQLMQASPLEPDEALHVIPQVCDALQYAHEEEIVHRDIKPENILIDKRGRVKIADFGLAKLLGRVPAGFTLTGSHQVMGTPHYMAPEQMEKPQSVDHRADIYSLGVVFYEMLTGELPLGRFAAPSQKATVDVRLDQVVLRALEKEPGQRYQRASEVKTDVEAIARVPAAAAAQARGAGTKAERELIRYRVMAPAAGLVCTGFLALIQWAAVALAIIHESGWQFKGQTPREYFWLVVAFIAGIFVALSSGVLVVGAAKMMRLRSYELATMACLWAMVPWSAAFIIGLPFGLWALLVLHRPEVRAAFQGFGVAAAGAAGTGAPGNPLLRKMRSFVQGVRYFAVDSLEGQTSTPASRPALLPPEPAGPQGLPGHSGAAPQTEVGSHANPHAGKARPDQLIRDLLALLGMVGLLVVAWLLLALLRTPEALDWFPVIPFLGYYLWLGAAGSRRARLLVGVVGVCGVLALAGISKHYGLWQDAHIPWWSLLLGAWFFWWLFEGTGGVLEEAAERQADKEEATTKVAVHGLTDAEAAVWLRLKRFHSQTDLHFQLAPDLDAALHSACRKSCRVPPDERVLGLLDFTGEESGDNVLVFGCRGIYYQNFNASTQPGPGSIAYSDFPQRAFANHGREVYLGQEQFLYTDPDHEVDCEQVANLLNALRQVLGSPTPAGGA